MNTQPTSEEKLLNIIRKKDKEKKKEQANEAVPKKKKKGPVRTGFDFFKFINRLLFLAIIGFAAFLGFKVMTDTQATVPSARLSTEPVGNSEKPLQIFKEEPRDFQYYRDIIQQRDVFLAPWHQEPKTETAVQDNVIVNLSQQISLVGIVLDENPQAIIEDQKSKQTYFVQKGQKVSGATVVDIQAEKVVLQYNEQTIELTP